MAYKTPNKTSEYLRSIMKTEGFHSLEKIIEEAEELRIPILLPESAAFLRQLVILAKPTNVLEIGTAIGYSGSIFLLNSSCTLTTIDKNTQYLQKAANNFDKLGVLDRVEILEGDADIIVPTLSKTYDFIFLDGPKTKYVKYLPFLKTLLSKNGILLADNVLFNGMVAGEAEIDTKKKKIVSSLDKFLKELYNDIELVTSVLNVGDGMSLSMKQ